MIRKIKFESRFNSQFLQQKNNVSFGSGPLIVYGIPNRWEGSYSPKSSRSTIVKYGVPDRFDPQSFNDDAEPPLIKYGIPDSGINDESEIEQDFEPEADNNPESEVLIKYGIPHRERSIMILDNEEKSPIEEIKTPKIKRIDVTKKPHKTSYFKRLWFAILGKDV